MKVMARYYGFFSTVTKKLYEPLEIENDLSVKDLIDILAGSYGYKFSKLCFIRPLYSDRDYVNICINSLDLNSSRKFPQGLKTSLQDGDTISFGAIGGAA